MDNRFAPYRLTDDSLIRPERDRFAPKYQVRKEVHQAIREIERADHELRDLQADRAVERRIWRDALARNAFGTASIEGNPLSLEEVQSLLQAGHTPERMLVPDEQEILNHAALMEQLDGLELPGGPDDVAALHARLFEGVMDDAGRFKERHNFIGRPHDRTVVYVPTAPEQVRQELAWALDWLHDADEHPLVRIMVFFHEFQAIHPFRDGNGRIGRLLSTIALYHFGYPGVRYALVDYTFNNDREGYYGSLAAAERSDWDLTVWIDHMAKVLQQTFQDAVRRFAFLEGLPGRINQRQVAVASWFLRNHEANQGRRVKFADIHAAFPEVPRRTLQYDLARLVEAGAIASAGRGKGTTYHYRPPDVPE